MGLVVRRQPGLLRRRRMRGSCRTRIRSDRAGRQPVAVLNRMAAERYLDDVRNAVGPDRDNP